MAGPMLWSCIAIFALKFAYGAEPVQVVRDESALVQRGTLLTMPSEADLKPHPAEKIAALKEKVSARVGQVMSIVNHGVSDVNSKVEHSVGNMMSRANSALDDIESAYSNAVQGVKDSAEAAADPIAHQVNERTSLFNTKVKTMIGRVNQAIDDSKGGMRDFAHGMTGGIREASEKITEQLAQSVHEHVRQEIELARAAEPASLLQEEDAVTLESPHPAQKIAALKEKVHTRVNEVMTGMNKGLNTVQAKVDHSVGNMMSKANSAVEDINDATNNALQGFKDFTESATEPIVKQVNQKTGLLNGKVKLFISKINKGIDDMKGGMRDFAHGMTDGLKEASEKIAAQLAQSVHEHVRQEIELARAAEPASL